MKIGNHHYAIDAAKLVERCRSLLHSILDVLESNASSERAFQRRAYQLLTMCDALKCVDRLIHTHLLDLLDREIEFLSSIDESDAQKKAQLHQFFGEHTEFPTLLDTVETLRSAEKVARNYRRDDKASVSTPSSLHRRTQSTPPAALVEINFALSIDDPVEEDYSGQGWYSGRNSPSPPPSPQSSQPTLQSAGDSSSPQHQAGHRRKNSMGGIGIPALPLNNERRRNSSNKYSASKGNKDSSLFRLIVTLQLCLVRIEEANSVLCNGKARAAKRVEGRPRSVSFSLRNRFSRSSSISSTGSGDDIELSSSDDSETSQILSSSSESRSGKRPLMLVLAAGITLGGSYLLTSSSSKQRETTNQEHVKLLTTVGKAAATVVTASFIRKRWRILTMNARVANSSCAIEEWIFGWIVLVNNNKHLTDDTVGYKQQLNAPRKSLLWYSNGSIRFQLIKRGMDLLYASIGKAIEITRGEEAATKTYVSDPTNPSSGLWTYVVASLAASYYNVIGPATKSASSIANLPSSVIHSAWGMVSLPAVKKASLEATRILKGASIADNIEICGVSCFVLSREPCPALSSALRRYRRRQHREDTRLGIIHETNTMHRSRSQQMVKGFEKQNIILHLTGGGFFAHTIAGDLPYLLDWSARSKAIIIVPEYALLPHTFPDAINEITNIYSSLRSGQAATLLGFQADRIIVSGESVGGNLAAALCVSLVTSYADGDCVELTHRRSSDLVHGQEDSFFHDESDEVDTVSSIPTGEYGSENRLLRFELPDALILSCPFLNLSLDPSPSRIDGANDPVLPSALISTISNSYLHGASVTDPLASPYFASNEILHFFPPTLIFTSSEDPLLDDSVAFNGRLRSVGVKSRLRAVPDMPHAFWALSTAGIPEARQVQKECQQWLAKVFSATAM